MPTLAVGHDDLRVQIHSGPVQTTHKLTREDTMSQRYDCHRLELVDALRGFALAGIVVAHALEQYTAAPRPVVDWWVARNSADSVIAVGQFIFVVGKFYALFALLFGMSFAIMMGNAASKGRNFSGRFIWRLTLLLGFGVIHSLIYRGDILGVYVIIGFLLPLFYNISNRWLWLIATVLFLGAGRLLFFAITGKVSLLSWENSPESPAVIDYVNTLKSGSFLAVVEHNLHYMYTGKLDFQFGIFGRGYFTLAYFLVGMWLVRSGIVYRLDQYRPQIKKLLWLSLAMTLLTLVASMVAFTRMPQPFNMASWHFVLSYNVAALGNVAMTALLTCSFVLWYLRHPQGRLTALAPYGRMALTNYVSQSVVGTFALYGWGLGYLGEFHDWQMLLAAGVMIALQIHFSHWWLKRFHYGPLEWLWRCGTWGAGYPLRRLA